MCPNRPASLATVVTSSSVLLQFWCIEGEELPHKPSCRPYWIVPPHERPASDELLRCWFRGVVENLPKRSEAQQIPYRRPIGIAVGFFHLSEAPVEVAKPESELKETFWHIQMVGINWLSGAAKNRKSAASDVDYANAELYWIERTITGTWRICTLGLTFVTLRGRLRKHLRRYPAAASSIPRNDRIATSGRPIGRARRA